MKLLGQKLAQCWLDKSLLNLDIFNKKDIPSTRKEAYQAQNFFYRKIKKKNFRLENWSCRSRGSENRGV